MIFIYEILKIIFLRGSLKNLNFFEPKKFTINYLYLSSCVDPTSLTISNLFIDNIKNTFKGQIIIQKFMR